MKVEIKHHTGWQTYDMPAATSLAEAAYLAVRQSHDFLTDDNHTHQLDEYTSSWGGKAINCTSVWIMRNEKSTPYRGPKWAETPYWFAVDYREPGTGWPSLQDLVKQRREAAAQAAQGGTDSTVTAVVNVNQGKATAKPVRTRRGPRKAASPPAG